MSTQRRLVRLSLLQRAVGEEGLARGVLGVLGGGEGEGAGDATHDFGDCFVLCVLGCWWRIVGKKWSEEVY